MHTEDLISKFLSHVLNHFLNSIFMEHSFVHGHSIEALVGQSENAIFSVFDSFLATKMRIKIAFNFMQLLNQLSPSPLGQVFHIWTLHPSHAWIFQLLIVDILALRI